MKRKKCYTKEIKYILIVILIIAFISLLFIEIKPDYSDSAQIQAENLNISSNTEFPAESYLTLRAYEYKAVPTELFYVYLGKDEQIKLFDYKRSGNWVGGVVRINAPEQIIMFTLNNTSTRSNFDHIKKDTAFYTQNLTFYLHIRFQHEGEIFIGGNSWRIRYKFVITENITDKWLRIYIPEYYFEKENDYEKYMYEFMFQSNVYMTFDVYEIKFINDFYSKININGTPRVFNITDYQPTRNIEIHNQSFIKNYSGGFLKRVYTKTDYIFDLNKEFKESLNYTTRVTGDSLFLPRNPSNPAQYLNKTDLLLYISLFNFSNDEIGEAPAGWQINTSQGGRNYIIQTKDWHYKTLQLASTDATGNYEQSAWNSFNIGGGTSGDIYFWTCADQTNKNGYIFVRNILNQNLITIKFRSDGKITAIDYPDEIILQDYNAYTWYHFRISFIFQAGSWMIYDIFIDTVRKADDFNMLPSDYAPSALVFYIPGYTDAFFYFDAIDYSWAPGHFLNRNLYPETVESNVYIYWESPKINVSRFQGKNVSIMFLFHAKYNASQNIFWNIRNDEVNYVGGIGMPLNYMNNTWSDWDIFPDDVDWLKFRFILMTNDLSKSPMLFSFKHFINQCSDYYGVNITDTFKYTCFSSCIYINYSADFSYICEKNISLYLYNYQSAQFDEVEFGRQNNNSYYNLSCMKFKLYRVENSFTPILFNLTFLINFSLTTFIYHKYINYTVNLTYRIYENLSYYEYRANRIFFQYQFNDSTVFLETYFNSTSNQSTNAKYGSTNGLFVSKTINFEEFFYINVTFRFIKYNLTLFEYNYTSSLKLKNFYVIFPQTYCLESEMNRQRHDILVFEEDNRTLLIKDVFGREVYREIVEYKRFIDIFVNIAEIILVNDSNETVWFGFSIMPDVVVYYIVPPYSLRIISMLFGDYAVYIQNETVVLEIQTVSISRLTENYIVYKKIYEIAPPQRWTTGNYVLDAFLTLIIFLFNPAEGLIPWGLIIIIAITVYITYKTTKYYLNRYLDKKEKKKNARIKRKLALENEIRKLRGY